MNDSQCGVILIPNKYFRDFHLILACISIKSRYVQVNYKDSNT
jgi:hypothetical protein